MGLDNGFVAHGLRRYDIPSFISIPKSWVDKNDLEIAYWRKCWNVRDNILNVLHMPQDKYKQQVEAEDIPAIIRALAPLLTKEGWEDNDYGSIWTFEEAFENNLNSILNLKWLHSYMKQHPEVTCYFYDYY